MKTCIVILSLLFLSTSFYSTRSIHNVPFESCPGFQEVSTVLEEFDKDIITKEYVIIIPENACQGCVDYTFSIMDKLVKSEKISILSGHIDRKEYVNSKCVKIADTSNLEREMEIYGITLVHLKKKGETEVTHLNPGNIKSEYEKILGVTLPL